AITRQGSRLVRWAAIEAVQHTPKYAPPRATYQRMVERRGAQADTIATVTVARKLLTLVHYGLRDGEIPCPAQRPPRRSEWGSYGHGGCSAEFQRPRLASLFDVFASWSGRSSYDGATRTTA